MSPLMGVLFFFLDKNTEYQLGKWRAKQTVRCQFVLKQKEQLQGTLRGVRGKLLKEK